MQTFSLEEKNTDENTVIEITDKKRKEFMLMNRGRIVYYSPLKSVQVIFYDIHSSDIPDLWALGCRRKTDKRYIRVLICRNGCCEFSLKGKKEKLSAGHVMIDYSMHDEGDFNFESEYFRGVEISLQASLLDESQSYRNLRRVIKSMTLPEQQIKDSNGYVFSYSPDTEKIVDKYMKAGFNNLESIINIAYSIVIGHNLGNDLKRSPNAFTDKQLQIAKDIRDCLTNDFSKKWTAQMFAEKYGVSDTTVKSYFKSVYGYGFKEYQVKIRMEYSAQRLATTDDPISDISSEIGFLDYSMFTKAFKKYYGVTPKKYRRNTDIINTIG